MFDTLPTEKEISIDLIKSSLMKILLKRFPQEPLKQGLLMRGKRINIACPYCGDSVENPRKKRGNFYIQSLTYKCYNDGCDIYKGFEEMLVDHDALDNIDPEVLEDIRSVARTVKKNLAQLKGRTNEEKFNYFVEADFSKILVPRSFLMDKLKLWDIGPMHPAGVYLSKRMQTLDNKFAWDSNKNQIYIFNLDPTGNYILGLQIRYGGFSQKSKYLTYPLYSIWTNLLKNTDESFLEEVKKVDSISTIFGLLKLDFNKPVTLFEGPMDHFLFPNSAGLCSVNNDWPFDVDNIRWLLDNDKAGKNKAIKYLHNNQSIFLWNKYLKENGLLAKKIKDFNDVVVMAFANNIKLDREYDKYFSQSKWDLIEL